MATYITRSDEYKAKVDRCTTIKEGMKQEYKKDLTSNVEQLKALRSAIEEAVAGNSEADIIKELQRANDTAENCRTSFRSWDALVRSQR